MPSKIDEYRSPGDKTVIELDPKNNGSLVQKAFLLEGILNLFTIPLITHPHTVLSYCLNDSAQITPATTLFARLFGGVIIGGLTTGLWSCVPNTKTAIHGRKAVYLTLGMGEVMLIPILVLEAMKGGNKDAALSVRACLVSIACLVPLVPWRAYVLFMKPELMGRYREVKRE